MGDNSITGVTVEELKSELTSLRTAISDIYKTGQSYNRQGLAFTAADLGKLQEREKWLTQAIRRAMVGAVTVSEVRGTVYPYPVEGGWDWDETT
jgi:hypothetical protein